LLDILGTDLPLSPVLVSTQKHEHMLNVQTQTNAKHLSDPIKINTCEREVLAGSPC